jgi:3-oxoacyl-[acyl-carrier-protein] synthase III
VRRADLHAFVQSAEGCAEFASMLYLGGSLLDARHSRGTALLVCADRLSPNPLRAFGCMSELVMRDVFSDGAAALVLEHAHPRVRPIGVGGASEGHHWDYFDKARGDAPVNDIEVMTRFVPVMQTALQRCLESAALSLESFDCVIFPLEGSRLPISLTRALRIPREKVFLREGGPTHVGMSDPIFSLESYLGSGQAIEGQRILVASRTIGVMRFIAFQV